MSGNVCPSNPGTSCYDIKSASDWLFVLGPSPPARFGPLGTGPYQTYYQWAEPDYWPRWGYRLWGPSTVMGDLSMGGTGELGADGCCDQGHTFAGVPNEICGCNAYAYGDSCWGETNMEVWYPVA